MANINLEKKCLHHLVLSIRNCPSHIVPCGINSIVGPQFESITLQTNFIYVKHNFLLVTCCMDHINPQVSCWALCGTTITARTQYGFSCHEPSLVLHDNITSPFFHTQHTKLSFTEDNTRWKDQRLFFVRVVRSASGYCCTLDSGCH